MAERLTFARVVLRSLRFHWRAHALLALAMAVAMAVLAGALVVGWSLQHTLTRTLLDRLGSTREIITLQRPASVGISDRIGPSVSELTYLRASATDANETVLPVAATVWAAELARPPRGWELPPLAQDEVVVNEALARDLGVHEGDEIVVRLDVSHSRPGVGLFAYRDPADVTRLERLRVKGVVAAGGWADFSLAQTQASPRNLFVSRALIPMGPTHLVSSSSGALTGEAVEQAVTLDDLRVRLRETRARTLLQSLDVVFPATQQAALESPGHRPYSTYIARTFSRGGRHVSYGLVAADLSVENALGEHDVVLNPWVAEDLSATVGDEIELETLIAREDGSFDKATYALRVAAIREIGEGLFVPEATAEIEGLTTAERMDQWQAPFPVDIQHITPRDEDYWDEHRATPKALLSRTLMMELWRRSGFREGLPVTGYVLSEFTPESSAAFCASIVQNDPQWQVIDPRDGAQRASRGSADFASLFVGMSAFLIIAAIAAAASLARMSAQARLSDLGLASAMGIATRPWLLSALVEYSLAMIPGVVLGVAMGVVYAVGLLSLFAALSRGVWEMPQILLDIRPVTLVVIGCGLGVLTLLTTAWQLRHELRRPVRELLSSVQEAQRQRARITGDVLWVVVCIIVIAASLAAARSATLSGVPAFFIIATSTLLAAHLLMRRFVRSVTPANAYLTQARLNRRFVQAEPRRAMLSFTLFAVGSFVLCAVALFRGAVTDADPADKHGPTGGFTFRINSTVAQRASLETAAAQANAGLSLPASTRIYSLLTSTGTEGGCLNLAVPGEMQLIGVTQSFMDREAFDLRAEQADRPWQLLQTEDGPIPVFGDEETMLWIQYRQLGDVFKMPVNGVQREFRLVGMVRGGLFSGQLLLSADNLRRLIPDAGYGLHFVESADAGAIRAELARLADVGMTVERTTSVIAAVRSVQTLYMTLFLALGGLGLLLGGVGSLVLMVRDVNERRGELALLSAVGLSDAQITRVVLAWHVLPVCGGLFAGVTAAALGHVAMDRPMGLGMALALGGGVLIVVLAMMAGLARLLRPHHLAASLRTAA